ncbi:MAG: HAMP domain-containing sensor histidine kinase [Pseudomonadota bacterium]
MTRDRSIAASDREPGPLPATLPAAIAEIAQLRDALQAAEQARAAALAELAELKARESLSRRDAAAAGRAKDELLSVLGHELRNPLNALVTSAEVLRAAPPGGPVAESARGVVARQTRKLAGLIDRLVDVGRVLADDITLAPEPLELREAVEASLAIAGGRAAETGGRLVLHADAPVRVRADRARIAQVMAQLLDHALRHAPAGGTVTVELRRDAGAAVVTVHDTGPEIAADLLSRIFEPFARRGADRTGDGPEVGLALVRRVIELHGGSVHARSSTAGNLFEWRVPLQE